MLSITKSLYVWNCAAIGGILDYGSLQRHSCSVTADIYDVQRDG